MRHDGCGGRAAKAELLTGVDGVSSRPVRKIRDDPRASRMLLQSSSMTKAGLRTYDGCGGRAGKGGTDHRHRRRVQSAGAQDRGAGGAMCRRSRHTHFARFARKCLIIQFRKPDRRQTAFALPNCETVGVIGLNPFGASALT